MRLLVQLVIPYEHRRAKCIVAAQIGKIDIDSANNNLIVRKIPKISDCVVHRRKPSIRHNVSSFLLKKIIPREPDLTGDCSSNFAQIGKRRWGGIMPPRFVFLTRRSTSTVCCYCSLRLPDYLYPAWSSGIVSSQNPDSYFASCHP